MVRIVDHGDSTTLLGADGIVRRFDGDSAGLLRAVLEAHALPCARAELLARLAALSGGAAVPEAPVDELLALLERAGVLVPAAPVGAATAPTRAVSALPLASRRVVLGITGAVAAIDAPVLVRGLAAAG